MRKYTMESESNLLRYTQLETCLASDEKGAAPVEQGRPNGGTREARKGP